MADENNHKHSHHHSHHSHESGDRLEVAHSHNTWKADDYEKVYEHIDWSTVKTPQLTQIIRLRNCK